MLIISVIKKPKRITVRYKTTLSIFCTHFDSMSLWLSFVLYIVRLVVERNYAHCVRIVWKEIYVRRPRPTYLENRNFSYVLTKTKEGGKDNLYDL